MTLTESGNLGIGTTSADVRLHLHHASDVAIKFSRDGTDNQPSVGHKYGDHYIRKTGHYLRFFGEDNSTVLFELQNSTLGDNVCSFPNATVKVKNHWPTQTNTLVLESDYPGHVQNNYSKTKIKMTSIGLGGGAVSSYISQGYGSGSEYYIGMGGDSNGYALAVTNAGRGRHRHTFACRGIICHCCLHQF